MPSFKMGRTTEDIRRELSAGTDGETIIIITRDTDPSTEPD